MKEKHSELNKIVTIAISSIKFENTIIKHQLPVSNYTNIITYHY